MKKLLTILLTVALTLSLTTPALAVEAENVPAWQEYGYASLAEYLVDSYENETEYYAYTATAGERLAWVAAYEAAHPDEVAAFDADAYFAKAFTYYEDKNEYLSNWEITDEAEFRANMLAEFIVSRTLAAESKAQWTALQAQEPQRVAEFLEALPTYLMERYGADTIEAYVEQGYALNTDQAHCYLYQEWNWEYEYWQQRQAEHDKKITDLGGTPGQINILLNDKCIPLTAGQIQAVDGAVSIPNNILSKALGITIKGAADSQVPVRANAEKAGFQVFWDDEYQTVVLIDKKAVVAQLDAQLSQLNKLVAELATAVQRKAGQAYTDSERLTADVTLFNTLDGDTQYTLSCRASAIVKDGAMSGAITVDVAGLLKGMSQAEKEQMGALLPSKLTFNQLLTLAGGLTVNFILDTEDESLSFNIPALASFLDGYEKDTWVRLDMSVLNELVAGEETLGQRIYSTMVPEHYQDYYYGSPLGLYPELMVGVETYTALLGNDRFTEQGGALTYQLDTKTVNALIETFSEDSYNGPVKNAFRTANLKLSVTSGGKISANVDIRPEITALAGGMPGVSSLLSFADFKVQGSLSSSTEQRSLTGELHWKNQFKVKLDLSSTMKPTSQSPKPAPTAEDCLDQWDFAALLGTFFSGVAD